MKKVGILTFHRALSYGAALQAYALTQIIRELNGLEGELIDYGDIGKGKRFNKPSTGNLKVQLYNLILNLFSLGSEDIRRKKFKDFLGQQQVLSSRKFNKANIKQAENEYGLIITGSDQVWNPVISKGDSAYLLDFVSDCKKKVSYAASFGSPTLPTKYEEFYKKHLEEFSFLSVREGTGAEIIKFLIDREVEIVLDPTFLLHKNEWDKIERTPKKWKNKKYILLFNILGDPEPTEEICKNLKKKTGFDVLRIGFFIDRLYSKYKVYSTAGPREFIGLFKNASFVVTNSFHGTAFSIIYEKPFFTLLNKNDRNARMINLAEKLGLDERLIYPEKKIKLSLSEIDYKSVNQLLEKEREISLNFLRKALKA